MGINSVVVDQPKQPVTVHHGQQEPPPPPSLLSDVFPSIRKVRLEVEFYDAAGVRVQRRCRDLHADSPANLAMKCPLDSAPLDLNSVIEKMVSQRVKDRAEEVKCAGARADSRHSANYRIEIEYGSKRR